MKKKINGALYDTASSSLIIDSESITALSGRLSIRLFRTSDGQWFLTIEPDNKNDRQQYTCIDSETALCWLEKHSFNRQIKEYFGISDNLLQPERQILVAEWKSPNSTTSHDLIHVEPLYLSPMNTNTHRSDFKNQTLGVPGGAEDLPSIISA